jgi:light-harvesting complex I chlorophyll a/b binding protein 1
MKTFSVAAVALLASGAAAFAPAASNHASTKVQAMPERMWNSMVDKSERSKSLPWLPRPVNLDGSLAGDVGFDPFYLSSIPKNFAGFIQPPSWEETNGIPTLYWMRESELKHCRIAMLAVAGWLATDIGIRFPGETFSVSSIPTSYEAHNILVSQGAMGFMLVAVGFVEFCTGAVLVEVSKGENDREAGDFGFDPMGFIKDKSVEEVNTMKLKEINNGRLAMLAFGGIATQTALADAYHSLPYF